MLGVVELTVWVANQHESTELLMKCHMLLMLEPLAWGCSVVVKS